MISRLLTFAVIICTAAVYADIINANDAKTCKELCASCNGTASFVDGRCECYISDENKQDNQCFLRIKREADELGLDLVDCEPATADRLARCFPGCKKHHYATHSAHRIADYFMRGGPLTGSPMVGAPPCETNGIIGSSNPQSQPQQMPLKLESAESKESTPPEPMTGASNPSSDCDGDSPDHLSSRMNPAAYYHTPETFVGAPAPHYGIQSPYSYAHSLLSTALHPSTLGIPHVWSPAPITNAAPSPLVSFIAPHPYHGRAPYFPIPRTSLKRPQMPRYTQSPIVGAEPSLQELLPILKQALVDQNALLESISHQLENHAESVGIPRVFYPPGSKVGAPLPKSRENCDGNREKPAPVVSSALKKNDCNDGMNKNAGRISGRRPPRMSVDIEQSVEKVETVEVTTEKAKREARPDANGRKRKRELKKILETKSR